MSTVPIPQGATVGVPAGVPIPRGAQIGEPISQSQPSMWDVLRQPTEKTDQEYLGYKGAAGVAGATVKGLNDVARGTLGAIKGIGDMVAHPIDTAKGITRIPSQAAEVPRAIHDINASPDPTGHYLNAAQDTTSQGAGQALTALAIPAATRTAAPALRLGARSLEAAANQKLVPIRPILNLSTPADEAEALHLKVPGRDVGLRKPVYPGASLPEAPPPEVGQARGLGGYKSPEPEASSLGRIPSTSAKPEAPAAVGPSRTLPGQIAPENVAPPPQTIAKPIPARQGLQLTGEVEKPALGPSRTLPGMHSPEDVAPPVQSIAKPIPARSGLQLKGEVEQPAPSPIARPALGKALDSGLRDAVGNKPVRPGVAMRDQLKPVMGGDVPEGHTPVESTAVKSFKYDPAAKELHVTTKNGTTYISGEVTPEQAEMFETADSKGQAWKAIRDNSRLVAKVVNGKRVASIPSAEFRSVGPNDPTPGKDLTPKLRESLRIAKAGKMGITR